MMFAKKRRIAALVCLVLSLTVCSVFQSTAADFSNVGNDHSISPRMQYILDSDYDFYISGKTASMYVELEGRSSSVTKCEITINLQEKGIFSWNTVESWSTSKNGYRATLSASHSVTSGKTYRMVATVTAWSGSQSESKTLTSNPVNA